MRSVFSSVGLVVVVVGLFFWVLPLNRDPSHPSDFVFLLLANYFDLGGLRFGKEMVGSGFLSHHGLELGTLSNTG